jgi:hypothetical protein
MIYNTLVIQQGVVVLDALKTDVTIPISIDTPQE